MTILPLRTGLLNELSLSGLSFIHLSAISYRFVSSLCVSHFRTNKQPISLSLAFSVFNLESSQTKLRVFIDHFLYVLVGSLDREVGLLSIDERVDGQVENEIVEKEERGGENGSGSKNEMVVESTKEETNDVMDILEEFRLSVEEPELSEEQLMTNFQSQEDQVVD